MLGRTTDWTLIFGAWLIAATSTLGALFLSDVMQLAPCSLCWYQRIFMFSMVVVLAVGLFPFDRAVVRYGLPLAVIGWLFAGFHQLLIAGVIPDELQPCTQGVPCSAITIEWFGFVTIPTLSLLAFSAIMVLLVAVRRRSSR
ncbi:MAG: disulfide bond formation protein B [Acidobacteria bacterium]|nr:disulfide bond formation protein B [Acidobacteriota bacterium]